MTDLAAAALIRKRAELAGEIERMHEALKRMIADLGSLDATLRLFDPGIRIEAIRPKAFRPSADWAKRGEVTRLVLDILRQAAEPMTTRGIAFQLLMERALDNNDAKLLRPMTKRVAVALRYQRDTGVAVSAQGPGQYTLWALADG
jgi:hypothetical protein